MYYSLGKVNDIILRECFGKLITDEVVVTLERLRHILTKHPQDFELLFLYGKMCVEDPDLILQDSKHEKTVFMIKRLRDTNINVILRLALQGEDNNLKNSVMTFYRIRDRNLKKLAVNHKILYNK